MTNSPTANPILVPILGDQLTRTLASLRGRAKDDTVILMMEVWDEATYVKHHKQKIVLIFSAMRHFAAELRNAGWTVDYVKLGDDDNSGSFTGEVARAVERHSPSEIHVVEAGEWRVQQALEEWPDKFACPVEILPDDRYLCTHEQFRDWAEGRKTLTMEHFYREMRKRTDLLMADDGKPEGGDWNYDAENRQPPGEKMDPPPVPKFSPDDITTEVMELVAEKFADHFGNLESFHWPVTRAEAEDAADAFFAERIEKFGPYQDAMVHGSDDLYHSMLSTSINCGLLDPLELCQRAQKAYEDGRAPLNSVEGFIRQIIGWREFIRGFYWLHMPGLESDNAMDATRPLPEFFWTGDTDMRCLSDCIRSTHDNAHAHHIQRLMVLGNFCLIAGNCIRRMCRTGIWRSMPMPISGWNCPMSTQWCCMPMAANSRPSRMRRAAITSTRCPITARAAPIPSPKKRAMAPARSTRFTGISWIATVTGWKAITASAASMPTGTAWERTGSANTSKAPTNSSNSLVPASKGWARND